MPHKGEISKKGNYSEKVSQQKGMKIMIFLTKKQIIGGSLV